MATVYFAPLDRAGLMPYRFGLPGYLPTGLEAVSKERQILKTSDLSTLIIVVTE